MQNLVLVQHMCGACARGVLFRFMLSKDIYVVFENTMRPIKVGKVCCDLCETKCVSGNKPLVENNIGHWPDGLFIQ